MDSLLSLLYFQCNRIKLNLFSSNTVFHDISKIQQRALIGKIFARWHLAIAITSRGYKSSHLRRTHVSTVIAGGGRKGGTNTAIPHMVAREYRNTASKFSQIPKPQLQMGKSWHCQYYKSSFQIETILLCQCFQIMVRRCQAYDKHKIIALV